MVTHPIMSIFQFTPDDLVANRAGYATSKQTYRKIQPSVLEILFMIGFGLWAVFGTLVGIGMLSVSILFDNGLSVSLSDMFGALFYAFILIILPAYVTLYLIRRRLQKRHDRHTRTIHRVSGPITLEERESNDIDTPNRYYLHVGGEKLELTYHQYKTLQPYQNTNWHIYYFPHSKIIASLEHW